MELDGITVFVKVVQSGSFSQAAKALGMPNSTVSAKVSGLEKRLGVTLLQRTTRKLNVTQAGEAYFKRCLRALEELGAGEAEVVTAQKVPQGLLRITATADSGHSMVPPLVQSFLQKYPEMEIELILTNRVVDLVAEGVDLALRPGELEDSSLIGRKLMDIDCRLFASPSYIKKHGTPASPKELQQHEFVKFLPFTERPVELRNGKEKVSLKITRGKVTADDLDTIRAFALIGMGVALLPVYRCQAEEKSGKLVRVLPQWNFAGGSMQVVYPAQRFVSPKVRAFVDHAAVELHRTCK